MPCSNAAVTNKIIFAIATIAVSFGAVLMLLAADIQSLVARLALNNDSVAYKQLFLYYHPRLLSFSYAITHCRESSEEAVSDVFLKIWNSRNGLLRISNFQLYIYISTKNTSLNYLAAQKRSQALNIDEVKTEFASLQYNPEQLMMTAEFFRQIQTAVSSLPARCQLVFKLVKEDGLSYKETAELLQISPKTVENQISIALRKLGETIAFRRLFHMS